MHHLFLDESGEFGFSRGSSAFLLITVISTRDSKRLKNAIKRRKKRLYDAGWPRNIEIKGTTLWGCANQPGVPQKIVQDRDLWLNRFINGALTEGVSAHYSIIRKSRLGANLRNAPYGIAYNYFAGTLLCRAYATHFGSPLTLIADQRNKESHDKLYFSNYIKTRLITECQHNGVCDVHHMESHDVVGLQAVDFISWGLFRHYEHGDGRFRGLIQPRIGYRDNWYA